MPTNRQPTIEAVLSVTVKVEGSIIDDSVNLLSIDVEHGVNQIGHATILVDDPKALSEFKRGAQIEIEFSYNHEPEDPIFEGIIVNHEISIEGGKPVAIIDCYDQAIEMDVDKNSTVYEEMNLIDVVDHICNAHGIANDVNISNRLPSFEQIMQTKRTDWDFMAALALSQGAVIINRNGKIDVQRPNKTRASLGLQLGKDIINVQSSLGDIKNSAKAKPIGIVQSAGSLKAAVGDTIRLKGIGKGFNGDAYISAVTHTAHNGSWLTTYDFGLDFDELLDASEQESLFPATAEVLHTLVSNNGHSIIVDEAQNIITVTTADGNRLVLDDANQALVLEDTNDNSIVLNENEIQISSAKSISISAGELLNISAGGAIIIDGSDDVTINAAKDMTLNADKDALIDAQNITLDASASLSAKGVASAKLESTAQTSVVGSLVTIN